MRRAQRLSTRSAFADVLERGGRATRPEFVLYHFAREAPGRARVGLRVSRRVGRAVVRNRVRRMLREAIRPLYPQLVACDIVVVARPAIVDATVADLERQLGEVTARAGLLRTTHRSEEKAPR